MVVSYALYTAHCEVHVVHYALYNVQCFVQCTISNSKLNTNQNTLLKDKEFIIET